jgi:hypothetical protein
MSRTLTFLSNNGETLTLGTGTYFITKINGLEKPSGERIASKTYNQRGENLVYMGRGVRNITIEGIIRADNWEDVYDYRMEMQRILNDEIGEGKLTITVPNSEDYIFTTYCTADITLPSGVFPQTFQIIFTCSNPYLIGSFNDILFNSPYETSPYVNTVFELPFEVTSAGVELATFLRNFTIVNEGQAETPPLFRLLGKWKNPIITNETTGTSNKWVYIYDEDGNETDGNDTLDLTSIFFQLKSGDNVINITDDLTDTNATMSLEYNERWLGI